MISLWFHEHGGHSGRDEEIKRSVTTIHITLGAAAHCKDLLTKCHTLQQSVWYLSTPAPNFICFQWFWYHKTWSDQHSAVCSEKGKRGRGNSWLSSLLPLQDREPPVGAEKVSRFGNLEKKEDLGRQLAKITSREGHKFHCQFQIEYLNPICWWEAANLASSSSWWWFSSYCLSLRWEGWRWGGWGRRR